jgi:hypothetical protein
MKHFTVVYISYKCHKDSIGVAIESRGHCHAVELLLKIEIFDSSQCLGVFATA